MDVSLVSSVQSSDFLSEIQTGARKRGGLEESGAPRGDTVTLSEEARRLAEEMMARKAEQQRAEEEEEKNGFSFFGGSAGVAGGSLLTEAELRARITELEEEVQELGEAVIDIMSGEQALEEKVRITDPLIKEQQDKLEELVDLKNQAEMNKMKGAGRA